MFYNYFSLDDRLQRLEIFHIGKNTKYIALKIKIIFYLLMKRKISVWKVINVFISFYSYLFKLDTSGKTPVVIIAELSNRCNESCVFCRDEKGRIYDSNETNDNEYIEKGSIDYDLFHNIIHEVKKTTLLTIPYTNGEPFVYQHLDQVLHLLKVTKMGSMLSTNGLLLNEKNINLILQEDLDQIKIHVSGFTNKVHQIEHRVGNVELIKENMINLSKKVRLHKSRLIVLVDYILYEHNKHELEQFRRFAKALGFGFNIRPGNNKGMEETEKAHIRKDVTDMPCEWLWKVMAINWNGDLLPCCDYVTWSNTPGFARYIDKSGKDLDHHTNTTSSVTKTWNGEKVIKMRQVHRTDGRKPIPICSGCSKTGVEYKY